MLKLIKMELLKLKRKDKHFDFIIACLVLSMLLIPTLFMIRGGHNEKQVMQAMKVNFDSLNVIPNIYLCILTVRLFMDEYKEKTINIMFAYPLSRIKIYFAKIAVIFYYSFLLTIADIVLLGAIVLLLNKITPIRWEIISVDMIIKANLFILLNTLVNTMFIVVYSFFVIVKRSLLSMAIAGGVLIITERILLVANSPFYSIMLCIAAGISLLLLLPTLYVLNRGDVV